MRLVSPIPNREGLIELGPCDGAFGLGDTLTITPLAAALGKRAVMLLDPKMAHLQFLFRELCPTRFSEKYPVFTWKPASAIKQKLAIFGITGSDLPIVRLRPELLPKAREMLAGIPNPLAFCPTCSKAWEHIRQRPFLFWKPIIKELSQRYTVCQFGRTDYPTLEGVRRMPFVDLELLAAMYQVIGNYCGVDTGDYHLMLAVGGRCVVADADPMPMFQAKLWGYQSPKVEYGKLSHPGTVLAAIERMGL